MTIHPIYAELSAPAYRDDLHRLSSSNRLAVASRGGRVPMRDRLRDIIRQIRELGCQPAFGGCPEELIDTRTVKLAPIAE